MCECLIQGKFYCQSWECQDKMKISHKLRYENCTFDAVLCNFASSLGLLPALTHEGEGSRSREQGSDGCGY